MKSIDSELVQRYKILRDSWRAESWVSPTAASMQELDSFRQLVAMGEIVIPLILADIKNGVPFMHIFLYSLTTERPTKPFTPGDIKGIEEAWLDWGILKGYLSQE